MSGSLTIRVPKNDNQVDQASLPETMLEEICSVYLTRNEFVAEMEPSFFPLNHKSLVSVCNYYR